MEEKKRMFTIDGITLAGAILLCNECANLGDFPFMNGKAYFAAFVSVVGTIGLDLLFRESKEEKLFRSCGIESRDELIPLIIKKTEKEVDEE